MADVVTCSQEQVDWAISILDQIGEGEDVDGDDFAKANAVLSAVSISAFGLAERLKMKLRESKELKAALGESIKLQSHYAGLLNQYDGGERLIFGSIDDWIERLQKLERLRAEEGENR